MIHGGSGGTLLEAHGAWQLKSDAKVPSSAEQRDQLAALRRQVSQIAGNPVVLTNHRTERTLSFANRRDVGTISQQGPVTPDHVIRTKRVPAVGRDIEAYASAYRQYFERNAPLAKEPKTILDPAPRVILDPELGMCTAGRSVKDAGIVADLYQHTMDVIERSTLLGGFAALPEWEIFEVEYWDLEQAKLRKSGRPPLFAGEVALVTGAARVSQGLCRCLAGSRCSGGGSRS
jgi:rhamnose utilization protein RhaD (predicted bifunctional aldolase and dehydrogenase)